jgi:uroporphyrinogen decarboxylase
MNYKPVDRCVYGAGVGAWPETVQRWISEGYDPALPPKFDTDRCEWAGQWFYPNPPFERNVIEEDDHTILYVNHEGILMRELKDNPFSSMPQFVKFPVETRDEFRKFYKERMQPDLAGRIGQDYGQKLAAYRDREYPLMIISGRWGGFFGGLRSLVGVERLCMLFYDDPAFVEEMMDAVADFIIAMLDRILNYTDIDVYGFWEDMAYKTGSLINPDMFRKFALPRYKRVVEFVKSRGVPFVALDSDGDISSLIPIWVDAGIDVLYPFEVQCGMDVLKVRKEYGNDLRLWYGLDKRAIALRPKAIDAELERIRPLIEEGGYIPGPDHSLPPDVPFENYLYYMNALRKIV